MINLDYLKKIVKTLKHFIFGNNYKEFRKNLKNKILVKNLQNLKDILREIFLDIKKQKLKKI